MPVGLAVVHPYPTIMSVATMPKYGNGVGDIRKCSKSLKYFIFCKTIAFHAGQLMPSDLGLKQTVVAKSFDPLCSDGTTFTDNGAYVHNTWAACHGKALTVSKNSNCTQIHQKVTSDWGGLVFLTKLGTACSRKTTKLAQRLSTALEDFLQSRQMQLNSPRD